MKFENRYYFRKYNMLRFILMGVLLEAICLISCREKNEGTEEEHISGIDEIRISSLNDSLLSRSITHNQKYLVLNFEKSPQSALSRVFDLQVIDGRYYITDNIFTGIKIFDSIGNFERQIGSIGDAVGQFKKIYAVDYYKNFIYLLSEKGKLLKYDLSGNHIRTLNIGFNAPKFKVINDNKYIFFTNGVFNKKSGNFELVETDSFANVKKQFITGKKVDFVNNFSGFLNNNNDGSIMFNMPMSKTVYQIISEQNPRPIYNIVIDNPVSGEAKASFQKLKKEIFKSNFVSNIIDTKNFLIIKYINKGAIRIGFYDKRKKEFIPGDHYSSIILPNIVGVDPKSELVYYALTGEQALQLKNDDDMQKLLKEKDTALFNILKDFNALHSIVIGASKIRD